MLGEMRRDVRIEEIACPETRLQVTLIREDESEPEPQERVVELPLPRPRARCSTEGHRSATRA